MTIVEILFEFDADISIINDKITFDYKKNKLSLDIGEICSIGKLFSKCIPSMFIMINDFDTVSDLLKGIIIASKCCEI